MALLTSLIKAFKDKALARTAATGQARTAATGATQQTGQDIGQGSGLAEAIASTVGQLSPGSERPGAAAENEELRTNRRTNRGITDNIRATRVAGRFGSRNTF